MTARRIQRPASSFTLAILLLGSSAGINACTQPDPRPGAQKTQAIQPNEVKAESPTAMTFTISDAGGAVRFEMDAPLEKQDGTVPKGALSGAIHFDLKDLTKSRGLIDVNIGNLEIYQQKAKEDAVGIFGDREKSELQNEHMKDWLEIGPDAPLEERGKNTLIQFEMKSITSSSTVDVTSLTGAKRRVTISAVGDFRLHQRTSKKTVALELVFTYEGDTPMSVQVSTVKPFAVDLDEHDVRPRTAFGILAQKGLSAMSPKVSKEAKVSVDFVANAATN